MQLTLNNNLSQSLTRQLSLNDLKFIEIVLRKGKTNGIVQTAYDSQTSQKYAVRILQKSLLELTQISMLLEEITKLSQLDHPHIAKYYGALQDETQIYIVMEFIEGTSLKQFIKDRILITRNLVDKECSQIIYPIASALAYLHENSIVHRDISLENVLLEDGINLGSSKLIDFGLSLIKFNKSFQKNLKTYKKCNQINHYAPEMITQQIFSQQSADVWSLGVILYELLTLGKHPIQEYTDTIAQYISKLENLSVWDIDFSNNCELVQQLLQYVPENRPEASSILSNNFITQFDHQKYVPRQIRRTQTQNDNIMLSNFQTIQEKKQNQIQSQSSQEEVKNSKLHQEHEESENQQQDSKNIKEKKIIKKPLIIDTSKINGSHQKNLQRQVSEKFQTPQYNFILKRQQTLYKNQNYFINKEKIQQWKKTQNEQKIKNQNIIKSKQNNIQQQLEEGEGKITNKNEVEITEQDIFNNNNQQIQNFEEQECLMSKINDKSQNSQDEEKNQQLSQQETTFATPKNYKLDCSNDCSSIVISSSNKKMSTQFSLIFDSINENERQRQDVLPKFINNQQNMDSSFNLINTQIQSFESLRKISVAQSSKTSDTDKTYSEQSKKSVKSKTHQSRKIFYAQDKVKKSFTFQDIPDPFAKQIQHQQRKKSFLNYNPQPRYLQQTESSAQQQFFLPAFISNSQQQQKFFTSNKK